ncbi:hypothetical protein MRX96_018409 [Rhipicephalus microplus]
MASFVIQALNVFSFSSPNKSPKWKQHVERFRTSSGLCIKPEQHQVDTLLYIMGEQAEEIYPTFALSEENSKKFDAVVELFHEYFIPQHSIIFERAKFNTRLQQDGKSAKDFVTVLHTLSKDYEFGTLQEEFVRDHLVVWIKDKQLSARVQLDAELTQQKALDSVRQIESVRQQQTELHQKVPSLNKVASGAQTSRCASMQDKSSSYVHWASKSSSPPPPAPPVKTESRNRAVGVIKSVTLALFAQHAPKSAGIGGGKVTMLPYACRDASIVLELSKEL